MLRTPLNHKEDKGSSQTWLYTISDIRHPVLLVLQISQCLFEPVSNFNSTYITDKSEYAQPVVPFSASN